jgi:hypothetical protein
MKKKKIYRQNIFLQVLIFITGKNSTLRRFVNTLSDRLAIADPASGMVLVPLSKFLLIAKR